MTQDLNMKNSWNIKKIGARWWISIRPNPSTKPKNPINQDLVFTINQIIIDQKKDLKNMALLDVELEFIKKEVYLI